MTQLDELDGVSLMEGEELLHECRPHWMQRLQDGRLGLVKKVHYVVTTERVIEHRTTWTSSEATEYPIRDIDQIQASAEKAMDMMGIGDVRFSVGGGGDKIPMNGIPEYQNVADSIREQQRTIAE